MTEFYYTCLECIWKHLRDAEHHIEDAVTEAQSKGQKNKVLFFSELKEQTRQIRKHIKPSFDVDLGCTSCNPNPNSLKLDRCVNKVKETKWCKINKCNPYAVCKSSIRV